MSGETVERGRAVANGSERRRRAIRQLLARRANRVSFAAAVLSCLIANSMVAVGQTDSAGEYQVKAAFLYNFAKFIEWPAAAFTGADRPLTVCVFGHDPFGRTLEDSLLGKSIGEHRVVVGHSTTFPELAGCQIVFAGASERERIPDLVNYLRGRPALLVGESEGFAALGGSIQFTLENNRVHFVINPDAADRAGLKISSKLLALARIVRDANPAVAGAALK